MSQRAISSPLTTAVGRPRGPRYAAFRKIRCHMALMSLASSPTIHGFRWWKASAMMRLPLPGKFVHSPQPWTPSSVRTRTNVQMSGYSTLFGVPPFDGSTVYTSTSTIFMRAGSLRSLTACVRPREIVVGQQDTSVAHDLLAPGPVGRPDATFGLLALLAQGGTCSTRPSP